MSTRLTNALVTGAYTRDIDGPTLDLTFGGQNGWTPNLAEYVNNAAYVSRPAVCLLIEAPKMFTTMPNSEKWLSSLKALFELHPKTFEGLAAGLEVEVDEHAVGGAGEMQSEVVNVTRARSQPKFSYTEKYGRPIQMFLDYWIRYGMMDPETKSALLGTMNSSEVTDLLPDWYSATCLFFVPDPLHKRVDKAWLVTNMFPKGNGEIVGKRDLATGQEVLSLDIEFSGIAQYNNGVKVFAQQILDAININNADPFNKASFLDAISADVTAVTQTGYKEWIERSTGESVTNLNR